MLIEMVILSFTAHYTVCTPNCVEFDAGLYDTEGQCERAAKEEAALMRVTYANEGITATVTVDCQPGEWYDVEDI